jgi:hypothetical protein
VRLPASAAQPGGPPGATRTLAITGMPPVRLGPGPGTARRWQTAASGPDEGSELPPGSPAAAMAHGPKAALRSRGPAALTPSKPQPARAATVTPVNCDAAGAPGT